MKTSILSNRILLVIFLMFITIACSDKDDETYKFGMFSPQTTNLAGLNSAFDDINLSILGVYVDIDVVFSSNRNSSGLNYDFVSGKIGYKFNVDDDSFVIQSDLASSDLSDYLKSQANTSGNEYGPMRLFNGLDGREYFYYATDNEAGKLNLKFLRYYPSDNIFELSEASVTDVSVLNSPFDDAYITFDWDYEKAYFTSNRKGGFDIYEHTVEADIADTSSFNNWLISPFKESQAVTILNSKADDKCPYVVDSIMVFTSNREGGLGGYDLYVSKLVDAKWSEPVNMGPSVNTEFDEYRPVLGVAPGFINKFLIFSSNRPGGKGGYDLYFKGFNDI